MMALRAFRFSFLFTSMFLLGCNTRSMVFEIPDGYVGWVVVRFAAATCESSDETSFRSVIQVSSDGRACSVQDSAPGTSFPRYYYVSKAGDRRRQLEPSAWGGGGRIWSEHNAYPSSGERYSVFFVGTEGQFNYIGRGPSLAPM